MSTSVYKNICHILVSVFIFGLFNFSYAQDNSDGLTNVGYAPFNITSPHFNCEGFIESVKPLKELHIAFLYNSFGNDFRCLNKLLADVRLKTLEVNLINEPGHRNGRLGPYEFLYGVGTVNDWNNKLIKRDAKLKQKLTEYVKKLQNNLNQHLQPHTSLLINSGLESNVSTKAGRVLIAWTRPLFPNARMVWNPHRASLTTRKVVNADLIEGHGINPPLTAPCIYNMDGTDVKYPNRPALNEDAPWGKPIRSGAPLFQQMEKYANRCEVALVWTQEGNGLDYRKRWADPRKREHNISTKMYKQIMRDIITLHRRGKISTVLDTYNSVDNSVVASCDLVLTNFEDGYKRGRLLKQSEFSDRGGVIILNSEYSSVRKIFIIKGESVVDEYDYDKPYEADGRPLFRSNTSPVNYPFNTYIVFNHNSKKICFKVPNPRIRLD